MKITRIDLEGEKGRYATASRRKGSDWIEVTIITPETPNGRKHQVAADCEEDIFSMAECMQERIDGCRGTNSMIHDYYNELLRFAD